MARNEIQRAARLVGVGQRRIERVVHQREIHAAGGFAAFPVIERAGRTRMLIGIAVAVFQLLHRIPCGAAVAALRP